MWHSPYEAESQASAGLRGGRLLVVDAQPGGGRRRRSRNVYLRWRTIWRSFRLLNQESTCPAADPSPDQRGDRTAIISASTPVTPNRACFRKTGLGVAAHPCRAVVDRVPPAAGSALLSR